MCYKCFDKMAEIPSFLNRVTDRGIFVDSLLAHCERKYESAVRGEIELFYRARPGSFPKRVPQEELLRSMLDVKANVLKRRNRIFTWIESLIDLDELNAPTVDGKSSD